MKKFGRVLLSLMFVLCVICIYFYINPNKLFEQVFKFKQDYTMVQADNVRIYTPPTIDYEAKEVLASFEPTRDLAEQLFEMDFSSHSTIAMFVTLPDYRGHERLTFLNGAYMNRMETILIDGENLQFASSTSVHEYSHFLFDLYLKEQGLSIEEIPAWFTEGLAEYFVFRIENSLTRLDYYDALPFAELHENVVINSNTIYLQGFYAIYDLIEQHGDDVVAKIISAYKAKGNFKEAFEAVTMLDYASYHKEFRLNQNHIGDLDKLQDQPQQLLSRGEELLANKATISAYSPFVLPYLVNASINLGDIDLAKQYYEKLDQLLYTPADYLVMAQLFAQQGESEYAKQIIERARYFATHYHYDLESFEEDAKAIQITR